MLVVSAHLVAHKTYVGKVELGLASETTVGEVDDWLMRAIWHGEDRCRADGGPAVAEPRKTEDCVDAGGERVDEEWAGRKGDVSRGESATT